MALPVGLAFQLSPNFYQSWWFHGIYAAVVVLVVAACHTMRVRQLRDSERALLLRAEERTNELQQEIANRRRAQSESNLQQNQFERLFQMRRSGS